jgi:hypothetical protein
MKFRLLLGALLVMVVSTVQAQQKQTFESLVGKVDIGAVSNAPTTQVPFITWGGDVSTFVANGGLVTTPQSIYGKAGLNLKLVPGDDFEQQVRDYLTGKSPYLRGTYHMVALASEMMNKDPRTKPVMVMQLTWSLGDHLVGRETIRTINDFKGKKICLQQGGPHIGLIDDSLKAAGMQWTDITVVWAKNLTGDDSPAAMFRKDPTIDGCCVISPDMIGLTSGLESVGSGGEGTVKGAHVVNSTASMSRSIADVYIVRSDYFEANKDKVEKFVVGYLKATESLLKDKETYNNGRGSSPSYVAALKLAQTIYGAAVLPTIEEDAHGLVSDANFVRIPGNEIFFNDPNNLTGFAARQTATLDLASQLGYISQKLGFSKADWDYKKLSEQVGVPYVPPVYAKGRIKAEVADFGEDLDSSTIFSFEIKFQPEQITFPVETYAADFKRYLSSASTFANAAVIVEGHSDPTLALQHFFWAAKAKGLITGEAGSYKFRGQPLDLADTGSVIAVIQTENLAGQKRKDSNGQMIEIPDPKTTVAAALTLSKSRADAVKRAIESFAKETSVQVDMSQALPNGVGISAPVNPRPRNMQQAQENMRVVFRVVRVKAEAISADDFNFDK